MNFRSREVTLDPAVCIPNILFQHKTSLQLDHIPRVPSPLKNLVHATSKDQAVVFNLIVKGRNVLAVSNTA